MRRGGFTLLELLCALAIVSLLCAVLLSAAVQSRRRAQAQACSSNVRCLGIAVLTYSQDYDGTYATIIQTDFDSKGIAHATGVKTWHDLLRPYVGSELPRCPLVSVTGFYANHPYTCGYAYNLWLNGYTTSMIGLHPEGQSEESIRLSSLTAAIAEARTGVTALRNRDEGPIKYVGFVAQNMVATFPKEAPGSIRHSGGANYAFLDGHAKWLRPADVVAKCDGMKPCFEP